MILSTLFFKKVLKNFIDLLIVKIETGEYMLNIVIIGAGQIGSRHLQAISKINRRVSVQVVDPSVENLLIARQRFQDCQTPETTVDVSYLHSINQLSGSIDFAIIATNANVRRSVIEKLIAKCSVRYLLLEKFLFQKIEDIEYVNCLLNESNIKSWINCPLRMVPYYRKLQLKFQNSKIYNFSVSGSLIGIGCNAIHYVDMLAYLTGRSDFTFTSTLFDKKIIESKRKGFIEFTGTLIGETSAGNRFTLFSYPEGEAPITISIFSDSVRCIICEKDSRCWISEQKEGWSWQEEKFMIPYQSQITHKVILDVLDTGTCDLPTYHESGKLHSELLKTFCSYLKLYSFGNGDICQIT